jgi:hypothetical protein
LALLEDCLQEIQCYPQSYPDSISLGTVPVALHSFAPDPLDDQQVFHGWGKDIQQMAQPCFIHHCN